MNDSSTVTWIVSVWWQYPSVAVRGDEDSTLPDSFGGVESKGLVTAIVSKCFHVFCWLLVVLGVEL